MTDRHISPLRYPGGKAVLAPVLAQILEANDLHDGLVVEPFAGGAGAALQLLVGELATDLLLNDADQRIVAFWRALLHQTDALIERVLATQPTMEIWLECREVYRRAPRTVPQLDLAFAVFFLNRCSRSGVLVNGGPIGGHDQRGKWKINARWDAARLVARIRRIASYRESISVSNLDARTLLRKPRFDVDRAFVFLDPPYYEKGQRLYLNTLGHDDHEQLAEVLLADPPFRWVLTYDDVPAIRKFYASLRPRTFTLAYSAYERRVGKELIVFDPRLEVPREALKARTGMRWAPRVKFGALTRAR